MAKAKKVMVIGLDCIIAPLVYKLAQEGRMPTVKKLLDNGVYGVNCLPPYPSITPPSWATLATGAETTTHELTCFNYHVPGTALDDIRQGFDSAAVHTEFIWEAAAKVGKKSIVVNYPTAWPPRTDMGWMVAGAGLGPNEWRTPDVKQGEEGFKVSLAYDQLWTTELKVLGTDVEFSPARKWENAPAAKKMLEGTLELEYRRARNPIKDVNWNVLLVDSEGKGFDRAIIAEGKDCAKALANLKLGEWSDTIITEFPMASGERKAAAFRMKLLELSPDGETFTLYRTPLCALEGFQYPEDLHKELPFKGLPMAYPGYLGFRMRWFDVNTLLEISFMCEEYLAEAAHYLVNTKDWYIYYMHIHSPDWNHHVFLDMADPVHVKVTEEEHQLYYGAEVRAYEHLDQMIARITEGTDPEETVYLITSDHGAKPTGYKFNVGDILKNAGLVEFKKVEEEEFKGTFQWERTEALATGMLEGKFKEFGEIDWSKTKAIPQRSCHIYINLKGRDPQGCVEPEDYAKVQQQIISALYDYTDPESGLKPIALALTRKDARMIGMTGEYTGDVVYAASEHYMGPHGGLLGTAQLGQIGDVRTLFIISGPGVKQGEVIQRTVWLKDVVPTLCYLADLPVPEGCEGGVVYQALEDRDQKL
ncbi:MAG: alkaline phosphatase family protein, partial [Chloroflexota bacterium]